MNDLHGTVVDPHLARLWKAQDGFCALCGKSMPPPMPPLAQPTDPAEPNVEHVWPKVTRRRPSLRADRAYAAGVFATGTHGNTVAAHGRCNTAKGGRIPTGCELLTLMAVNAVLGHRMRVLDRQGRVLWEQA